MKRIALCSLALVLATAAHAQNAEVFNPAEPLVSVVSPLNPNGGVNPEGVPACGSEIYTNGPWITATGTGAGGADLSVVETTLGLGGGLNSETQHPNGA